MNTQDINAVEVVDVQEENEMLTEFCASETTLGGNGMYREAGVGRFM